MTYLWYDENVVSPQICCLRNATKTKPPKASLNEIAIFLTL